MFVTAWRAPYAFGKPALGQRRRASSAVQGAAGKVEGGAPSRDEALG